MLPSVLHLKEGFGNSFGINCPLGYVGSLKTTPFYGTDYHRLNQHSALSRLWSNYIFINVVAEGASLKDDAPWICQLLNTTLRFGSIHQVYYLKSCLVSLIFEHPTGARHVYVEGAVALPKAQEVCGSSFIANVYISVGFVSKGFLGSRCVRDSFSVATL